MSGELSERLEISEIFESIQGEGPGAGRPCLFLRLAGCNLGCAWCDSRHAWDFEQVDRSEQTQTLSVEAVAERIRVAPSGRVVLTGGEPLTQQLALARLLLRLDGAVDIEVETNGTLVPHPDLVENVAQWNVSPKLSNSDLPVEKRIHGTALLALRDTGRAWLKLVVATDADIAEAAQLVSELDWLPDRALLMPQAGTREEYRQRAPSIAEAAAARGFRFSPRLHLELWNGKRGA